MADSRDSLPDVSTRLWGLLRVQSAAFMLWLRESQWVIASLASLLGIAVGYFMVVYARPISELLPAEMWVTTVTEARSVLLAFIGVEITALSIVMSLTMVTIQNAASQFSDRLLRYYIRDMVQQSVFGVIAGSSAYFVTVSAILGMEGTGGVPRPSLGLAVLLLMASGVALVLQVSHILQMVRLEVVLSRVVSVTMRALRRTRGAYGDVSHVMGGALPLSEAAVPVPAHCSGYVTFEETRALLRMATNHRYLIRLDVDVGNYALEGTPVGWVQPEGSCEPVSESALLQISESMGISDVRDPASDVGLGLRLLVDIAVKALSPGVNDPYTAGESIDHISTILARLADEDLGERTLLDEEGNPRVQICGRTLADYLALCTDQIARYGAKEPLVVLRLLRLARDIGCAARSQADRDGAVEAIDAIMAEAGREMSDPKWLETLGSLAAEARRVVSERTVSRSKWPVEL